MNRSTCLLGVAAVAMAMWTSVLALPPVGTERGGGDPAPRPALLKPAPAPAPGAPAGTLPDTAALLPAGDYVLKLTFKEDTMSHPVKIVRNGGRLTASVGGSETLSGTLDPAGKLQIAGGNGTDRLELLATVQNRRANGSAQLGRGVSRMNGSFTLDPATGARKLQEYGAPKKGAPECGFFCRVGKAWDCLKNWSKC